ncbi:MAG: hypothetical protein AAF950_17355 [Pseudomonadota bacterium]
MPDAWDINTTIDFWALVFGIVSALFGAWALMPGWTDYRDWLKDDPGYREKTVAALRGPGWDDRYRTWLEAGLALLDRRFGEAGSARALGVCTVISLCYAWSAFFLGYGMGAPGRLGEIELLAPILWQRNGWTLVFFAIVIPTTAFLVGGWLGGIAYRAERRIKAWSLRTRRRKAPSRAVRQGFESRYRTATILTLISLPLPGWTLLAIEYATDVDGLVSFWVVAPTFSEWECSSQLAL